MKRSETEGQKLGAAGGVTVHQGSESDLVGDPEACEAFDHHAQHGGTAIEEFGAHELNQVDLPFGALLEARPVGLCVGDGVSGWV
jgi:hypothetical protein